MNSMISQLLIACSRVNRNPEDLLRIRELLQYSFNWKNVLSKAIDEGVIFLLYRHIKNFPELVPAAYLTKMKEMYFRNSAHNLVLFNRLQPLLDAVLESEVDASVIKGGHLVESIYKDIGLRAFVDIDMLVRKEHRRKLHRIMKKIGFSNDVEQEGKDYNSSLELFWTYRPVFRKDRLEVELHYNFPGIHAPFSLENELWRSVSVAQTDNLQTKVLSSEYELCLLCLHAEQHSYERLIWMTDIVELAADPGMDWSLILDICEKEGIHASVYYGLYLVNILWPGSISQEILKKFNLGSIEHKLLRFFWPEKKVLALESFLVLPMHMPTFFTLLAKKKLLSALRTVCQFFFPPREWVIYYYRTPPRSMKVYGHYFWRLYRPILLLSRRLLRTG